MRATKKRCIGQEFTIKYLTNKVGKKNGKKTPTESRKRP